MRLQSCALGLAFGLLPGAAWAVPSNFGHPHAVPRGLLAAAAIGQVQFGEGLSAGLGGVYGLTDAHGLTFSATRGPSGDVALGLGTGAAFGFWGNQAKLGVSAAKVLGSPTTAGSVALDVGRTLTDRIAAFGEMGVSVVPGSPGALRYASALEYSLTRDLSVDVEYLGSLTSAGHSDQICGDVSLSLGKGQITATVAVPRAPVLGSPTYTLWTSWRLI
jgi:hypothetical protein